MISVIIPTWNEERAVRVLIPHLRHLAKPHEIEIVVSDGESADRTVTVAAGLADRVVKSRRGRAAQMNAGARAASAEILYFLHADTIPPRFFSAAIQKAVSNGCPAGCFRLSFDHPHWFLRFNAWFTRFNVIPFRFGDQSLFIRKDLFWDLGGFNGDLIILEDQEFVRRIANDTSFSILNDTVMTSARKYLENGFFRLQFSFILVYLLYRLGLDQNHLMQAYNRLITDARNS